MTDQKPRTALNDFALDILDLINDKLEEACNVPGPRDGALMEAHCGLHVLKERLRREDECKFAQLMLAFDYDFEDMRKLSDLEFGKRSGEAQQQMPGARAIFEGQ